ncbi:LacI family DNA-binding transcriptional regulator [Streptomyces buecherae]|uniref:LacI family DNA-binding transcriptional regulator n=1 Tax=Streptomyces buecherae TaxID=2763006 RepID=UPI002FCD44B5
MHDVARHAGVSVATASHVPNATRPVRPATRGAVSGPCPHSATRLIRRPAPSSPPAPAPDP